MEPLSVAASVIGIITVAAKISSILARVINKAHNVPKECRQLYIEVDTIRVILGHLQQFLLAERRAPRPRTSLLLVEQVMTTLAACVMTFSELDTFTKDLQSDSDLDVLDRLRWVSKATELNSILMRIESHKSSLNLMLVILTCQKQEEAEDQVDRLCQSVQKVLESNEILVRRLRSLEGAPLEVSNRSVLQSKTVQTPRISHDSIRTETGDLRIPHHGASTRAERGFLNAFEEILMSSRAYRKISLDYSDAFSIVSSAGKTGSWSMLSGLSLSEISHIGILAIPIYKTDIANKEAYDFNPPITKSSALLPQNGAISKLANKIARRQWSMSLIRPNKPQQQESQTGNGDEEIDKASDAAEKTTETTRLPLSSLKLVIGSVALARMGPEDDEALEQKVETPCPHSKQPPILPPAGVLTYLTYQRRGEKVM